jgi:hypothetical protein
MSERSEYHKLAEMDLTSPSHFFPNGYITCLMLDWATMKLRLEHDCGSMNRQSYSRSIDMRGNLIKTLVPKYEEVRVEETRDAVLRELMGVR